MTAKALVRVFRALNDAGVRYLVVGGLAVVAHGYVRFTKDLDLVLDFSDEHLKQAIVGLESLGYRPQVPVALADLASPEARQEWIESKNVKVLTLFSEAFQGLSIDILLAIPFDFAATFERCRLEEAEPGVQVPFVGLDDLLAMKEAAGRPQDLADVAKLRLLAGNLDREV